MVIIEPSQKLLTLSDFLLLFPSFHQGAIGPRNYSLWLLCQYTVPRKKAEEPWVRKLRHVINVTLVISDSFVICDLPRPLLLFYHFLLCYMFNLELMSDFVVLLTMRDHPQVLLDLSLLLMPVGKSDWADLVLHLTGLTYLLYDSFLVCVEVVLFMVAVVER